MKLSLAWTKAGPELRRPGTCEACGQNFACEISLAGCWCSNVALTDAARAELRGRYASCLCPACLRRYSDESQRGGTMKRP